jgi:protein-disulfide isomerase
MSSRKQQREEARARRLVEEKARAERERRARRVRMLGGIVLGAAALVAVAIAISSGGGGSSGLATGQKAKQAIAAVGQLLSGIPQSGARLGNPKAPVTLTYYGDLECPICRDFTLASFSQLVANDVRGGRVQVVYRSLETATRDLQTFNAQQIAALAAGGQQRFWDYVELLYQEQGAEGTGYVTESYLRGLASQIPGLNISRWQSARTDPALAAQIRSDAQQAATQGYNSTPTLVFQGPRGKAQPSNPVPPYSELKQVIKQVS